MKKRIRWDRLAFWGVYLGLCGLLCQCIFGCARRAYPTTHGPAAPATVPAEEALSAKIHRLEGELSAAKADLHFEQDRWLRYIATWTAGLCTLGAIACSVAAIFLPVMKKRLLIGAVALAAGIAVSLTIRSAIPALPWIGLGILGVGVCVTLPTFIKHAHLSKGG